MDVREAEPRDRVPAGAEGHRTSTAHGTGTLLSTNNSIFAKVCDDIWIQSRPNG